MDWVSVASRTDLTDGDIDIYDPQLGRFRGRIETIAVTDGRVSITTSWAARFVDSDPKFLGKSPFWEKADPIRLAFDVGLVESTLWLGNNGRITFQVGLQQVMLDPPNSIHHLQEVNVR